MSNPLKRIANKKVENSGQKWVWNFFALCEGFGKVFILLLTTFLVDSCCTPPCFVDKNCISYECNSLAITETDFELASLEPTKRMDFFQLFFADTTAHIDVSKWKVLNGDKPCKIRRLEMVERNDFRKIKDRKVYGKKLLLLSFKSKVETGDTIRIIEGDFPGEGNNLVVTINNLEKMNSSGFYKNGSPIGQMLPKIRKKGKKNN